MRQNQTNEPAGSQASRSDNVRRSSAKRKDRSHRKSGFIYLVLILLVIAVGVGVSFTVIFNTENIVVENTAERYSDEAIIKASGISEGDNMPRMNVDHIADRIEKELPYIGKAVIKRDFSNTVTITVEYTKAAAAIETYSGYVLIDVTGKVLETGVAEPADYIAEIYGAQIEKAEPGKKAVFDGDDTFTYVTGLLSDFYNAGFRNVTLIDIGDLANVTVEIDYRISVKLGSIAKASSKLKFGKKVIDENLANPVSGRLVVDLTEDNKAYVRSQKNIDAAEATEPDSETFAEGSPDELTELPEETTAEEEEETEAEEIAEPTEAPEDEGVVG